MSRIGVKTIDDEVFVYKGPGGNDVPQNVVRVRVDSSVTSIPARAFFQRKRLAEVELCEGLVDIGEHSFWWCDHSITKINIPTSLRRIRENALQGSLRCPIRLHDGIESIGNGAFASCIFNNFRVPPLITVLPEYMLWGCRAMFSLELAENMREIGNYAFRHCYCLRNVAFPPNADLVDDIFGGQSEPERYDLHLHQLFGSIAEIIRELQHRFDELPIHSIVYYQSYHEGVLQNLIAAINMRSGQRRTLRSKLDQTGNQQDCLGMTPLHILACSSVHNIELYRIIVEKYPANLITEDRWGALPLLYAFWGAAPSEIITFLLESYTSLYPDHVFNWTMMVETMGRCDTPKKCIENLLSVKRMHFPEQPIDWEYLLDEFARPSQFVFQSTFIERMQFLFMCCMSDRVEALAFQVWRDCVTNMIQTADYKWMEDNTAILREIQDKLAHFVGELHRLKEMTSILELAMWKMNINDNILKESTTQHQQKIKTDESHIRQQCRVTCGADIVIGHVLLFLITV
jgi:hypothetical protein